MKKCLRAVRLQDTKIPGSEEAIVREEIAGYVWIWTIIAEIEAVIKVVLKA